MKKNFYIYLICSILVLLFGLYVTDYVDEYNNNLLRINANIHQKTVTGKDTTLYVDFNKNNKEYSSVILINNKKKISISKKIKIYCHKNNLNMCVLNKQKNIGYIVISISILIFAINYIHFRLNKN